MASQNSLNQIQAVYIAFYGRPADPAGQLYWAEQLDAAGGDLSSIIDAFANSSEYHDRFGGYDSDTLVDNLYQQAFGRSAEPAGLEYWAGELDAGHTTLGRIALDVLNGARNEDQQTIDNKMAVADAFTHAVSANDKAYGGNAAIQQAKGLLDTITANADPAGQTDEIDATLNSFETNDFRYNGEILRFDTSSIEPIASPGDSVFISYHEINNVVLEFDGNQINAELSIPNLPGYTSQFGSGMTIAYVIGFDINDDDQNDLTIKIDIPDEAGSASEITVAKGIGLGNTTTRDPYSSINEYTDDEIDNPLLSHLIDNDRNSVQFSLDMAAIEQQLIEDGAHNFAEIVSLITPGTANWAQAFALEMNQDDSGSLDYSLDTFVYLF